MLEAERLSEDERLYSFHKIADDNSETSHEVFDIMKRIHGLVKDKVLLYGIWKTMSVYSHYEVLSEKERVELNEVEKNVTENIHTTTGDLDVLWQFYFVTGDIKYVQKVVDTMNNSVYLDVKSSASWSLRSNIQAGRVDPEKLQEYNADNPDCIVQ